MNCPYCNGATSVFETRFSLRGKRRRRECSQCKRRITTMEVLIENLDCYEKVNRKITTIVNMLEFVRENCGIAITQLKKMETELDD